MDFGTPPFPPPFAVTPDDFYACGQSGEPSWTTRGMEDGGGGPSSRVMEEGGVLGGRAPESQAPPSHFSHCSVSDVLLYGDSTGVWSTRWVLQSTHACTHTGLQSSVSGPVRWAGRNWWIPLESLSRLPAVRGCFPSRAQNPSGSLFVQPSAPRSPLAWEPLLAPGPPPVHMECLLTQPRS